MIKPECLEQIKLIADLYDIVSSYVQLKRSGRNWRGLSPFTTEKTPSFFVLPEKKFFKCFSTGYAGDVFRFLMLKENFSFVEAVEWLAKRYGIKIEYTGHLFAKSYSKNELLEIHEDAMTYFCQKFCENAEIQRYWENVRRFPLEASERYGIGWAPISDRVLLSLLKKKGYSKQALQECGLFLWNENDRENLWLRFSGRLMIPIQDVQDRVIGFSGRIIEPKDSVSKYVNSPESPIFHKGSILYGLNHARKFVNDQFVLVEGQLDAIRCWENGIHEAIAPQGTGLTETQMILLRRYTSRLVCVMDGDAAGQKSALRLVNLSFKTGIESQIVTLVEEDDPDSLLLREGKKGFDQLKKESMISFLSRVLLPQEREVTTIEREDFLKKIYTTIGECNSEVTQNAYLDELAHHLNLDRRAIGHDFRHFYGDMKYATPSALSPLPPKLQEINHGKLYTVEHDLLMLILHFSEWGPKVAGLIEDHWVKQNKDGILLLKVLHEIKNQTWEGPQNDNAIFSEEELNELFSILAIDHKIENPIETINACLRIIRNSFVKEKLEEVNQKIAQQIKSIEGKNLLDDTDFFKNMQSEKLCLRRLLISPIEMEA